MKTYCLKLKIAAALLFFIVFPGQLTGQIDRQGQQIKLVSISSDGEQGNGLSFLPSISGDGRYVSFSSDASNLVAGDNNDSRDIFVHDSQNGNTTRISILNNGEETRTTSQWNSISHDGNFVAFVGCGVGFAGIRGCHVYVHDRLNHQTSLVDISSDGIPANNQCSQSAISISGEGRFVVFSSEADNLVAGDTNGKTDVFVHDRLTHTTTRVSISSNGTEGNNFSNSPSISANGRYIAFKSASNNLVNDGNNADDVFVHDRWTRRTTRASVSSDGMESSGGTYGSISISADGRYVTFDSNADGLVESCNRRSGNQIYLHERLTGRTTCIMQNNADGNEERRERWHPRISQNGRYIVFSSTVYLGANRFGQWRVFKHDRVTGQTRLVSTSRNGGNPNGNINSEPAISSDGRRIVFKSDSNDLVEANEDVNRQQDIFIFDPAAGAL